MRDFGQGLPEVALFKPDDDGGDDHHCAIVGGALLVTGGQPTPLLQAIDAALDHVAPRVDRLIEGERPTRSAGALRSLIAALRDGVRDLPLSEQQATARVAVAFVGDEPIRARTRTSPSARSWDADAVQDGCQLGAVMPVAGRDDDRERPAFAVASHMDFARQPATAVPESLVGGVADPFFSSARLGRRRAPLAWWCARAVELSTLTSQTTSPTASDRVCACARIRSQVPSRRQR